jgi:hypothetical protein
MRTEKLDVSVTYDERRGYVALTVPGLRSPVSALSLNGLRRKIESLMMPDQVDVYLRLDRAARVERDQRRAQGQHVTR